MHCKENLNTTEQQWDSIDSAWAELQHKKLVRPGPHQIFKISNVTAIFPGHVLCKIFKMPHQNLKANSAHATRTMSLLAIESDILESITNNDVYDYFASLKPRKISLV